MNDFFSFSFKTILFYCLFFFLFSFLHFDFTIYFYILVLSKYLGNLNWEALQFAKLGKSCLRRNFRLSLTPCIFWMQINITVGSIVFDGNDQIRPKYPKRKFVTFYEKYYERSITTAFVFCCDPKHLDIIWDLVVFFDTCFSYIFPL